MLRCALFGHTITFQDPDERFFDLQYAGWTAQDQAKKKFLNWYDKCGNIETVLRGYKEFAQSVLIWRSSRFSTVSDSMISMM